MIAIAVRCVAVLTLAWAFTVNSASTGQSGELVTGSGIWGIDADGIWYDVLTADPLQWA